MAIRCTIRDCPAFGQVCRKCNKSNHFASVCNAKLSNSVNVVLSEDNSDLDLSVLQVETVSTLASQSSVKLKMCEVKLKMYDGSIMRPIGETVLKVKHNDSYHTLKFQVVDSPNKPLLSAESCGMLDLLHFNLNVPQDVHVVESTRNV